MHVVDEKRTLRSVFDTPRCMITLRLFAIYQMNKSIGKIVSNLDYKNYMLGV